jgi:hypothetical protein
METGTTFIKDGRTYTIRSKQVQNEQAFKSGMSYQGKAMHFDLKDSLGMPLAPEDLYVPHHVTKCDRCSFKMLCNGCSNCGGCTG